MEAAGVEAAARGYLERLTGLPLTQGDIARHSGAVLRGCPPFLLGCAAVEARTKDAVVRAVAPGMDASLLTAPLASLPGRRTDFLAFIPASIAKEPTQSPRAVAIPPDAPVSGAARVPDRSCAFGVAERGRFVSWASARDIGGIWFVTVETSPAHRGKGYARLSLTALTGHLMGEGKAPLYVCEMGNEASARTAQAAGFREYACFTRFAL